MIEIRELYQNTEKYLNKEVSIGGFAMDCLVPGIGEIIGGSQREENLEVLRERMKELLHLFIMSAAFYFLCMDLWCFHNLLHYLFNHAVNPNISITRIFI
jgi:hypothetical protein